MYFSTNMEGQRLNIIFRKFSTSSTKVKCGKVLCIHPQYGRLKYKHKTLQVEEYIYFHEIEMWKNIKYCFTNVEGRRFTNISHQLKNGRVNILSQNRNVEKHNVFFHKSGRWKTKHNLPQEKYTSTKM